MLEDEEGQRRDLPTGKAIAVGLTMLVLAVAVLVYLDHLVR